VAWVSTVAAGGSFIRYDEEQDRPQVSLPLLRRVAGYARPYAGKVLTILATLLVISGLSLLPPLLIRDLLDETSHGLTFSPWVWLRCRW